MKNPNWKADEMEISINFKSARNAFIFAILALLAYCLYGVIAMDKLLTVPFVIMVLSCCIFFITKVYLSIMMTRGSSDEE